MSEVREFLFTLEIFEEIFAVVLFWKLDSSLEFRRNKIKPTVSLRYWDHASYNFILSKNIIQLKNRDTLVLMNEFSEENVSRIYRDS